MVKVHRHKNKIIIYKYLFYLAALINFVLFNVRSSPSTVPKKSNIHARTCIINMVQNEDIVQDMVVRYTGYTHIIKSGFAN